MMKYAYAVMDGNQAPDQCIRPESCHHTIEAAARACDRKNARNPNAHYYVIEWEASRWAAQPPGPRHPTDIRFAGVMS